MKRRLTLMVNSAVFTKVIWKINNITIRSALNLAHKIHGPKPSDGAPPILVLHGLLGSKRNWDSMCKKITLATKKSVIAVDIRNHGESPHHSSHTYPELASDVFKLMSTLSIEQASIIGHSMGGRTGMVLALSEPSKIVRLLVVDISPISTPGTLNDFFPRLIGAMNSVNFDGIDNISKAKKIVADKIIAAGVVKNTEGLGFIFMNIGMKSDKSIGWLVNLNVLKKYHMEIASFPAEMSGKIYIGPTLFIGGSLSNYIPPGDLNEIKQFFPQAKLQYIEGVGHNVHAEDPTAFLNMVVDFFTKN